MKILLDTNVFIAVEPTEPGAKEVTWGDSARLLQDLMSSPHAVYLHPLSRRELQSQQDPDRRSMRELQADKYPLLPDPPPLSPTIEGLLGVAAPRDNDYVDHHLLEALYSNAVDILVTEDKGLHQKASTLGLVDRVYTATDAADLFAALQDRPVPAPPSVEAVKAHRIRAADSILESFRADYPSFDDWFRRCQRQHRQAWIVGNLERGLDALAIVTSKGVKKPEMPGKVLKISSFKVAPEASGKKLGELLLKSVFDDQRQLSLAASDN